MTVEHWIDAKLEVVDDSSGFSCSRKENERHKKWYWMDRMMLEIPNAKLNPNSHGR